MIRNFFTVALRNFLRHRFYSVINVFGLASGLTCALFIFLWVRDEWQTDKFHKDADHIFRIVTNLSGEGSDVITWTITPGPMADDIRDNVAGVEMTVRTMDNGSHLFQFGEKSFQSFPQLPVP